MLQKKIKNSMIAKPGWGEGGSWGKEESISPR